MNTRSIDSDIPMTMSLLKLQEATKGCGDPKWMDAPPPGLLFLQGLQNTKVRCLCFWHIQYKFNGGLDFG